MARSSADAARVDTLLAAVRDGAPVPSADEAALAFLRDATGVDDLEPAAALAAVAAAVELGLAAPIEAAGQARDKQVRKAARTAAHRLRSAGVALAEAHTGTTWSLGKEQRREQPPLALVGLPEDDGYVPFMLASFGDDNACLSAGVAGPGRGFRDDDHGHSSRSQARRLFDDAQRDHRLHVVPFHEAVSLLERAFDAAEGARPAGWGHLLSHLDEPTRTAIRVLDPLRALPAELDVDALHRPAALLDGPFAVMLQLDPERSTPFLEQALEAVTSQLYPDAAARRQRVEEIVDEAADAVLEGPARANWAYAMDVVAWLAWRAGDEEAGRAARATGLALRQGYVGRDVPWARECAGRNLSFVTDLALRMGQGPQAEE